MLGEKCYPSVIDIPDAIDIVDCFRKHDAMAALARDAVAKGAKVLWMQLGIRSAEAALPALDHERPDAIILDVHLPGLSGLDFLQLPPVRDSGLPVIAVSGVATESQARECLRLGAFDFLGKPVAFDRLGEVLAALEPHALHRQLSVVGRSPERRRASRVDVVFPVRILQYHGVECQGWAEDLSPFGMKVMSDAALRAGEAVKVSFTLPDGGPPVRVNSLVLRIDRSGHALNGSVSSAAGT